MVLMHAGGIARLMEDDDTKRWEGGGGVGTKVELGVTCMAMKVNIIFKETIKAGEGIEDKEDRTEDRTLVDTGGDGKWLGCKCF